MKPNTAYQDPPSERVLQALYWVIFALGTVLLAYRGYFFEVTEKELTSYACTLAERPEIREKTGRNTGQYLYLPIQEHSGMNFDLHDWAFDGLFAQDFVQNTHAGDSVFIWVHPEDYNTYLLTGSAEKTVFGMNRPIGVHQMTTKDGLGYLTLKNYSAAYQRRHRVTLYMFVPFMVVLFFYYQNGRAKERRLEAQRRMMNEIINQNTIKK
jgi:hypothetical protein